MENSSPGFRFRPTDEELVNYYLRNKNRGNDEAGVAVIAEVDVYERDPTELPGLSALETSDPEWYFFCPVDRNYPNGQRLGRSTESGLWKSTGKDRNIRSGDDLIGMKKTLVFYRRRGTTTAERTDWVIHEYRAAATDPATVQSHFVLCRVFDKPRKPAISEPVPALTPEFLTPLLDTANMLPHVEGQSRPDPVSETNQTTNPTELEQPPQDWSFLGSLCSRMPTPYHQLILTGSGEGSHATGLKAEEKEIAVVGHSATIAVSDLKKNSPLKPSSNSEELITNDRADRNSMTIILIEGETTKASRDRFSFWSFADILRVAAVVVILLILVISTLRSLCL